MTIGMPAVPELVSLALTNLKRNKKAAIYEGFLTPGWAFGADASPAGPYVLGDDAPALEIGEPAGMLIEDPIEVFRGLLDIVDTTVDPAKPTLSIRYSSQLADFERARERRATHEDQQIDHPGDRFYEYTGALSDAEPCPRRQATQHPLADRRRENGLAAAQSSRAPVDVEGGHVRRWRLETLAVGVIRTARHRD